MNASDHLEGLAKALAAAGWATPGRFEDVPAVLLVFASGLGGSVRVSVKAGTGGVPWFVSSAWDPLRPCHDLAGTVAEIEARLVPFATPGGGVRPARRWLLGGLRGLVRRPG